MNFSLSGKGLRLAQALQSRAFGWFWAGQTISALGDGAFLTALAVAVYALTGSSLMMGLFLTAQITPELLFTLLGGVAADRFVRRRVLFWADLSRLLAVMAIALLIWLKLLVLLHLFVLAVLFGLARSFFNPAYRAITPELVESDHLASANALTTLSVQCGKLLGPVLGAMFIALGGGSAALAFAFDGLTFLASVCSLLAIGRLTFPLAQPARQQKSSGTGIKGVLTDMLDGFRTIRASTWLFWSMIGATFGLVAYTGAITVSLPKLVFAVYLSNAWLLAAISTAVGMGAIAGIIFVGQFHLRHRGVIGFAAYITSGLALMIFSLPLSAANTSFVILPAAFVVGMGMSVMDVIWATLLYELVVPSHKLGRVASVDLLGSLGLLPLGYVFAGWISDRQGPAEVFLFGGLVMVFLNALPLFLRDIQKLQ
jgi:MFS family permease